MENHCNCCTDNPIHINANLKKDTGTPSESSGWFKSYWRISFSAILLGSAILLQVADMEFFKNNYFKLTWYIFAYLPVGLPVIQEAWEGIRKRDYFNEFTLMCIATLGAFYIGQYPEGAAVMLFYSLGELFQDKAVKKAKQSINALLNIRPEQTTVIDKGQRQIKSPQKVAIGDIIEIKAGERIPLDGTLLSDTAVFNTSALTGESAPCHIHQNEEVLAGMIVTDKVIQMKVTRSFAKSALSRILELVQDAAQRKAPAELFIRKIARIYTPIVIILAVLIVLLPATYASLATQYTFYFDEWFYRALVFLVISCPCALVVSIPLAYFAAIGKASQTGILFKGGNYLDIITQIDTVVFDKTGTLTKGSFEVQSCQTAPSITEEQLIQTIASVEQGSTHPIAKAIVTYAANHQITLVRPTEIKERTGYGMEGIINGQHVLIGSIRLFLENNITIPHELSNSTDSIIIGAIDQQYIGYLILSDTLKEDSLIAIERLKALKISNIQILSGDKQNIVTSFAQKLGISKAYGNLLPEGKAAHLEQLQRTQRKQVAFIGDGINDAPVLALSDVGIAMGGLGSDAAIETADIVIQTDQPSKVATAIEIGLQTRRIVWQNIIFALGIKILVILLNTFGFATLWEAVFADVGVTIIAVLNAMRLQRIIK